MKRIQHKVIKENIPLAQCKPDDDLRIYCRSGKGVVQNIGLVTLVKIKPIGKGMVQIKYRSQFSYRSVIQKVDLPGDTMVERTRMAGPVGQQQDYAPPSADSTPVLIGTDFSSTPDVTILDAIPSRLRSGQSNTGRRPTEGWLGSPLGHALIDGLRNMGVELKRIN